jgi:site-specific DNA-methyltransferase (adenine-specific)
MIDLRLGDCLEVMKEIPDKSIDMILCDLPYGTTRNKWDSVISLDKLWEQYSRIIKDNGAIVLFSQMPFTAELVHSNLNLFKYEWIWQKENGTGFLNAKKMPLKIHENIEIFYKKTPTYNPQMRKGFKPYSQMSGRGSSNYGEQIRVQTINDGERYPIDIIEFKRDKEKLHPTQKPIGLLEYLIKTYTNENETVLDNCMGSGSTGVACINTNRNFIGIELDENYYKIACERINNTQEKAS